ncbi:18310_t:CDS:2 [Funneliformis geosporum]|uniref:8883_t:CDS:1 n=1 Tax=Funneliformis geosporum TaxID=1117311 RepID=A0A9W4SG51_9GLOM|nr:18310_t:CDS:2 [Funneliformis geosporum]CAI2167313.1 8883_t:CDS:2 [Funneliformis geosporum]
MAFFTQKVWVEWIEQALANGEYNYQEYKSLLDIEQIGSSKIYKALMKKDDVETIVSMKFIGNKLSTREVVSELKLLRKIHLFNNENISKFYGVTKSENSDKKVCDPLKYMVILEYGDGGTLREYLKNNSENLHWSVRLKCAKQLCNGVSFLHENNIIHRNLMSESSNVSANLQNFLAYVDPQYFNIPNYKSSGDKQAMLTKKSDIYSLGVLLWELTSGYLPFSLEEHSDLQKEIMEGLREKDIDGIDKDYIEIYKKCWQSDPNDRPEIQEVVSAIDKIDGGVDPSMEQDVKTTKPRRRFTITLEPPIPAPPTPTVIKPVKSFPVINKPMNNPAPPPTASPKVANKKSNATLMVPNTRSRSKSPSRSRSKSPMARNKSPARPEIKVIKEEEEDSTTTSTTNKVESPVNIKSENSLVSAIMIKPENLSRTKSPTSRSKSPLKTLTISESPRSLSPASSIGSLEEQPSIRRSRPKSKSPLRKRSLSPLEEDSPRQSRPKTKSPLRILTRAKSPDFASAKPRLPKRSASVSIPNGTPRVPRRTQTMMPKPSPKIITPPRSTSPPKKIAYKPAQRRYSTSFINSSMQINAQSTMAGLWSNTADRTREDPTKKIVDELLSLFLETYEIDSGHALSKAIQKFLENQKQTKTEIFGWLLRTQLSLQYKILLGYFYLNGIGTSIENRKAFVLFLSAAKKQYAIAQDLLGYCYLNGKGTVKDETLAFEWYQKASANGSVTAFQSLGECYHDGRGSIKNKSKALQYFKMASDGGNVCGRNMLAFCYEMGLGVSSDHKKAFSLYKQAADAGYNLAKQNIAKCYQKGIGVAVDSEAAVYWLEKANQE